MELTLMLNEWLSRITDFELAPDYVPLRILS
jgi:hypothetical protein